MSQLNGERRMRRREKELKNRETIEAILKQAQVGRLATVNRRGVPVIKPVNFLYVDGRIYIHSSKKGEKIEDIRRGSPICFEVDEPIAYVAGKGSACTSDYYYRSIIINGKARLMIHQGKKLRILERMMEKYQPEGDYEGIPEEILKKTAVIEISIKKMKGKENLG
jgi:nitroimidazol reductase NimA-like FMN-containing flavoprotein (pyridoxamine 5'-phosphate oxidase superfamily)